MNDDGFARFLVGIGQIPLLTPAEERALALRVERGDLDAKNRMIESNLRLVVHVAKRYARDDSPLTLPDLVQEGTIGLVRAVEKFDPRKGYRFSTYAMIWIRQALGRAVAEKSRLIRVPVNIDQRLRALDKLTSELGRAPEPTEAAERLDWTVAEVEAVQAARHVMRSLAEPIGEDGTELGHLIAAEGERPEDVIDENAIAAMLRLLHPRERQVLQLRFGLDGGEAGSVGETARQLRMRSPDVRRIERYALAKLRASGLAAA
jgi:RNA polymerase primary sigma factor